MRRLIRNRTPDPLKVVNAPWTREAAVELIRDRFGLKLPLRTMGLPLERWACRPQKPTCKACRQLPAAV